MSAASISLPSQNVSSAKRSPHASRILVAAAALLLLASLAACSPDTTPVAAPAATVPAMPDLPPMQFDTIDMTIKNKPFKIEVADTEPKEARGLMNRRSMPDDHGMLFVFDKPDTYSFWMKNTYIPLDIIFLDSTGRVISIDKRLPLDENGHGPSFPALFVIELNAGTADAIGLKPGDSVAIPAKYLKTTPPATEK